MLRPRLRRGHQYVATLHPADAIFLI